jgi:hypothetical protein
MSSSTHELNVKLKLVDKATPATGLTVYCPGNGARFVVTSTAANDENPVLLSVQLNVNVTEEPIGSALAANDKNNGTADSDVDAGTAKVGETDEIISRCKLASFTTHRASQATAVVTRP